MIRAGEPRDFARHGVAMERAFAGGLIEHAGRLAQFLAAPEASAPSIAWMAPLIPAVHAGFYRTIAVAPLEALTMALLG